MEAGVSKFLRIRREKYKEIFLYVYVYVQNMFYWLAKKKESRDLILCKIWLDMKEQMSNIRIANYKNKTKVWK